MVGYKIYGTKSIQNQENHDYSRYFNRNRSIKIPNIIITTCANGFPPSSPKTSFSAVLFLIPNKWQRIFLKKFFRQIYRMCMPPQKKKIYYVFLIGNGKFSTNTAFGY